MRACYHLTGRLDYLLHVAVRDLAQLGALIKNEIASLPSFGKSETFLALSEIKPDNGWPIEDDLFSSSEGKMAGKSGLGKSEKTNSK